MNITVQQSRLSGDNRASVPEEWLSNSGQTAQNHQEYSHIFSKLPCPLCGRHHTIKAFRKLLFIILPDKPREHDVVYICGLSWPISLPPHNTLHIPADLVFARTPFTHPGRLAFRAYDFYTSQSTCLSCVRLLHIPANLPFARTPFTHPSQPAFHAYAFYTTQPTCLSRVRLLHIPADLPFMRTTFTHPSKPAFRADAFLHIPADRLIKRNYFDYMMSVL